MRIANAVPGMILAKDVFDEQGHLLLEKGITLTESYIGRLKKLGVCYIRIEDAAADALRIDAVTPQLRAELTHCFQRLFMLKLNNILTIHLQEKYFREINTASDAAITEIESHTVNFIDLQVRYPGADACTHAVNVGLLSLVTGMYLKLPRPVLRDLAVGAMLHDIGKALDLTETNELNPAEHTHNGYNLLTKSSQNYGICRIAAEHHENFDGTGFPAHLSGRQIHPLARIVAIANYYDNALRQTALTDTTRQDIIEGMLSQGNTAFDLNLLRAFFHTIALYPVGSFVRLSTGQTGYVIKNHARFPLRPLIRTVTAKNPAEVNLLHKPSVTIIELIKE